MINARVLLEALDQRIETPACWVRRGKVMSVTGDYSSDTPLVELDDTNGTQVLLYNWSAHALTVNALVLIVVQGNDQWIIGKHPGT